MRASELRALSVQTGKLPAIVEQYPGIRTGTILDVGCRSMELKSWLPKGSRYRGLDIHMPADVVADLDAGLPFREASFDSVIALDVLEHTERIHSCLRELCRVAKRHVLLSLPNMYEIKLRLKFLLGYRLGGKYGLPIEPPSDRHRWLFSFSDARRFCGHLATQAGFRLIDEGYLVGPMRKRMLTSQLVGSFPNLLAPTYVAFMERVSRP